MIGWWRGDIFWLICKKTDPNRSFFMFVFLSFSDFFPRFSIFDLLFWKQKLLAFPIETHINILHVSNFSPWREYLHLFFNEMKNEKSWKKFRKTSKNPWFRSGFVACESENVPPPSFNQWLSWNNFSWVHIKIRGWRFR